jgi:hypothetical protein
LLHLLICLFPGIFYLIVFILIFNIVSILARLLHLRYSKDGRRPLTNEKKEGTIMKKLFATATALMFALGLTVAAQAQTATEKPKAPTAPVQKVTPGTQEKAKDTAVTEAPKVAPAEAKKVEAATTEKKPETEKGKKEADTKVESGKEVKTPAAQDKKTGLDNTKKDKQ